jgi:Pentapeptide repeats (8 copies)
MMRQLLSSLRRNRDSLWGAAAIAASGVAIAVVVAGPQDLLWPAVGVAVVAGFSGLLLVLLGPFARYLAGERAPLSARERKRLSVKDRVDALSNVRGNILQSLTGLVIVAGLIFTGLGLRYTARTLDTTQQGQITDRYTKAIDQLGAKKADVRLGGIYALQRIAADSPRDQPTIMRVLTAYVLEHAQDPPPATFISVSLLAPLDIDVHAALAVIEERDRRQDKGFHGDLTHVDFHHRDLTAIKLRSMLLPSAVLRGADLTQADLTGADLTHANLTGANLTGADLTHANLTGANLPSAKLYFANLPAADLTYAILIDAVLHGANLTGADLTDANLTGADLTDATLTGADLTDAVLHGADLTGADLRGADLRQVKGVSQLEITKEARTDKNTKF